MKRIFKTAVLSVLFMILSGVTAFAGDTWVEENGNWYCYDADGNQVLGQWRASGGKKYYLDGETGAMAFDRLIDEGADKYYVNASGEMVTGAWQKVAVDNGTDGYEYMYFAPVTGKACVSSGADEPDKTIDGKKYRFSPEGYMLYGYLDEQDQRVQFPSEADKYFGTKEQAEAVTGWVNVVNGGDLGCNGLYQSRVSVWFYFDKGRKIKGKQNVTVETGKKYSFDQNGAMITGWHYLNGDADDLDQLRYYGDVDDGEMKKSQWITTVSYDSIGDTWEKDYYMTEDGSVFHTSGEHPTSLKKINGEYYCFDSEGEPQSDFIVGWTTEGGDRSSVKMDEDIGSLSGVEEVKSLQLDQTDPGHYQVLMYFECADDDTHASLQTGTRDIGGTTVCFDSYGFALEGIKDGKIYNNGIVQKAKDDVYSICRLNKLSTARYGRAYYMVDKAGNLLRNRVVKDKEGYYYFVDSEHRVYRMECNEWKQDAFRKEAAEAYLKNRENTDGDIEFTVNGATYVCSERSVPGSDNKHEKYVNVTWAYKWSIE